MLCASMFAWEKGNLGFLHCSRWPYGCAVCPPKLRVVAHLHGAISLSCAVSGFHVTCCTIPMVPLCVTVGQHSSSHRNASPPVAVLCWFVCVVAHATLVPHIHRVGWRAHAGCAETRALQRDAAGCHHLGSPRASWAFRRLHTHWWMNYPSFTMLATPPRRATHHANITHTTCSRVSPRFHV